MTFVYWIFDDTCENPETSGYVGVSYNAENRFRAHLRNKRVPSDSQMRILFQGSRSDCFSFENQIRPLKGIGWNLAIGGSQGWKIGFRHSNEAKERMRNAWTLERREKASTWKTEHNKSLKGQKRSKQSEAMTGEKNPIFGTKRPKHVIEAVRQSKLGTIAYNRQELYCIGCHQRCSVSIMNKYHNKCFKAWITDQNSSYLENSTITLRGDA